MKYVIYHGQHAMEFSNHNDPRAANRHAKARYGRGAHAQPFDSSEYKSIIDGKIPEPPGFQRITH